MPYVAVSVYSYSLNPENRFVESRKAPLFCKDNSQEKL